MSQSFEILMMWLFIFRWILYGRCDRQDLARLNIRTSVLNVVYLNAKGLKKRLVFSTVILARKGLNHMDNLSLFEMWILKGLVRIQVCTQFCTLTPSNQELKPHTNFCLFMSCFCTSIRNSDQEFSVVQSPKLPGQ